MSATDEAVNVAGEALWLMLVDRTDLNATEVDDIAAAAVAAAAPILTAAAEERARTAEAEVTATREDNWRLRLALRDIQDRTGTKAQAYRIARDALAVYDRADGATETPSPGPAADG